ncbi:MAG: NTP transferase domain-containing protein [Synergistales bacterium]|nr:NTP transferase domain-containing protein [Synergistales bacterium]
MLKGLIPAAGYSSRMGEFKPLIRSGGKSLLERAISSLRDGGVEEVYVVTGFRSEDVEQESRRLGCLTVHNSIYPEGMFSSVQAGIRAMSPFDGQFFFLPGDIPLVRPSTIRYLARSFSEDDQILVPSFRGRKGHPPLVSGTLCDAIANYGGDMGLRGFMDTLSLGIRILPVADRGILKDADTPEEFEEILSLSGRRDLPDEEEIRALLEMAGTADEVIAHQEKVAEVAFILAESLEKHGVVLDQDLLEKVCLLHDVMRHLPDHASESASFLHEHGFPLVADLVEDHMDIRTLKGLDERALLYLSDKLVSGTEIRGVRARMDDKLAIYGSREGARENIIRKMGKALHIQEEIEALTGHGIEEILTGRFAG